jgi:hypothetical protein
MTHVRSQCLNLIKPCHYNDLKLVLHLLVSMQLESSVLVTSLGCILICVDRIYVCVCVCVCVSRDGRMGVRMIFVRVVRWSSRLHYLDFLGAFILASADSELFWTIGWSVLKYAIPSLAWTFVTLMSDMAESGQAMHTTNNLHTSFFRSCCCSH